MGEWYGGRAGRASGGRADERTVGHGTHTKAAVWKQHLVTFLRELER